MAHDLDKAWRLLENSPPMHVKPCAEMDGLPEYGKTPQIWQKEFRLGHCPSLRGRTSPALKRWTENPELGSNFNLDSVFGRGTQVDFDCVQKSPRVVLSLIVYEAR
jgi:hypothetical protein